MKIVKFVIGIKNFFNRIKLEKILKGYCLIKDDHWLQFSPNSYTRFPWKIHIYSVEETDYLKLAICILPYLKENKILHKTVNGIKKLNKLNNTKQKGKAFTIYPNNEQAFRNIAKDLNEMILESNLGVLNSQIIGDKLLGISCSNSKNSNRIFYRYELKNKSIDKKDKKFLELPIEDQQNFQQENNLIILFNHVYSTDAERKFYKDQYSKNRGENNYLAVDMVNDDDIFINFCFETSQT